LLAKWRWRFLNTDHGSWKEVLQAKYGGHVIVAHVDGADGGGRRSSIWWKDICNLDSEGRWFSEVIIKKVGDGTTTSFWTDIWLGNLSLKDRFPRLFSVSTMKDVKVAAAGSWVDNSWSWSLTWRRSLFV
jgi:hypothetical protein